MADKLIVSTALILIVQSDPRIVIAALAVIIIGREIAVSALREWMAGLGNRHRVVVSGYGKLKTITQMTGLFCMLFERAAARAADLRNRGGFPGSGGWSDHLVDDRLHPRRLARSSGR